MNQGKIEFSKPDYDGLKKQGYLCADMHFHSTYSDGAATVEQILDKARTLNVGISITDHNEINGVIEAYKIKNESDFVLPGIEVKSDELVDILFYFPSLVGLKKFYSKEIASKKEKTFHTTKTTIAMKELIAISKRYDCLISAAHPFGYYLRSATKNVFSTYEECFGMIDVFEAINGGNGRKENLKSVEYLSEKKKGFTGGTDGHSIYPLGNIVTCAKADDCRSFLDSIKKKENKVIGIESQMGKIGEYGRFGINKLKNIFSK